MSPAAKRVLLILFLFVVCLFLALPGSKVKLFGFEKKFDLVMGLDLAGGSHLVFEADTSGVPEESKESSLESLKSVVGRRVNFFGVTEPNIILSQFEGKDRVIVELPGVKDTAEAVSLIGKTAQLMFAEVTGEDDNAQLVPTNLTGANLKEARVVFDPNTGVPAVSLTFDEEGAIKFSDLTEKNIGKVIPILLDGEIVSAPVVQEKIVGGSAQISGNFDLAEAKNLVIQLNAGALPIPIKLIEERTVGASLGATSIEKSVKAGLIGLGAVSVFMIIVYGKLGLVADIGLIIFGVFTLAIYKLIPVVLTLPGIAGFLISVGMAVDSNILIFERFKEEKTKRGIADALEVSFGRAWDSIRDANIATLVTAFILANPLDFPFLHTSGPVRGFAITLALGIGLSLFTGLFVSRNLLRLVIKDKKVLIGKKKK